MTRVLVGMFVVMGFVAGALAAEARHRDCVMIHYPVPDDREARVLGCVVQDGFHCFEYRAFRDALDAAELDAYPPAEEE